MAEFDPSKAWLLDFRAPERHQGVGFLGLVNAADGVLLCGTYYPDHAGGVHDLADDLADRLKLLAGEHWILPGWVYARSLEFAGLLNSELAAHGLGCIKGRWLEPGTRPIWTGRLEAACRQMEAFEARLPETYGLEQLNRLLLPDIHWPQRCACCGLPYYELKHVAATWVARDLCDRCAPELRFRQKAGAA